MHGYLCRAFFLLCSSQRKTAPSRLIKADMNNHGYNKCLKTGKRLQLINADKNKLL